MMDEVTLYNLYSSAGAGNRAAKQATDLFVRQMAIHLHVDHNLTFAEVQNRLGLTRKQLKEILENQ